jgi:hypothetical protein
MPGLIRVQAFADGPPRWYARRGTAILSGDSKLDVLSQIWDQDEAALGIFMSKLAPSAIEPASRMEVPGAPLLRLLDR